MEGEINNSSKGLLPRGGPEDNLIWLPADDDAGVIAADDDDDKDPGARLDSSEKGLFDTCNAEGLPPEAATPPTVRSPSSSFKPSRSAFPPTPDPVRRCCCVEDLEAKDCGRWAGVDVMPTS